MVTIHLRLGELRARRRLSQRQVAEAAGLRPDTVSALERGRARGIQFETLARLCAALDCAPGDLFALASNGDQGASREEPTVTPETAALRAQIRPLTEKEREEALALLDDMQALSDEILARRGGVPLDESWPIIREAREDTSRHW